MLNLNRMAARGRLLTIAVVAWVALAMSPWVPAAQAATTTPCSDDEVTVMVQGYPLACSPAGGTGYQTLLNAGFSVEGTQKFPEFICRINGFPDAGVDKCLTASPSSAYWTYWHAPLGATSWTYSDMGSLARSPQPGTVEAWTWGPGLEPGPVPVSRSTTTTETTTRSGSLRDSPMPTVPAFTWTPETPRNDPDRTTSASPSGEPTPEQNPDNPDEVLVFLDAEGNRISQQEYDALVTAASQVAQTRTAPGAVSGAVPGDSAPQTPGVAAATGTGESAETTTEEPDPKSTRVMTAPALEDTTQLLADGQTVMPNYDPTTNAQDTGGLSQAWTIGLALAFIALFGGAAAATWVLRRGEVHG